jgi:NAD dependent epimerase/dehydratase family enzyme
VLGKSETGGALPYLKTFFKLGLGATFASGKQYFPWIHEDDLTSIFLRILQDESIKGVLHCAAPELITNEQLSNELASVLHRPRLFWIPEFAINMTFGTSTMMPIEIVLDTIAIL